VKTRLTKTTVDNAAPASKPYEICDRDLKGFLLRVQPSGVKSFYVSYRNIGGKRQRFCLGKTGTISSPKARKIAEDKLARIKLGADIQKEKKDTKKHAERIKAETLGLFISNVYGPWRRIERKDWVEELKRVERNFNGWYESPLSEIDDWLVSRWRQRRIKAGISLNTINRDVNALKAILSHAVKVGVLEHSPLINLRSFKLDSSGVVRYLKEGEEERLRKALEDRESDIRRSRLSGIKWQEQRHIEPRVAMHPSAFTDHIKPIVLLLLNTGVRPSELLSLDWNSVYLKEGYLTILGFKSKNGRTRHIPLSGEARGILISWRNRNSSSVNPLVFPSPDSGGIMDRLPRAITRVIQSAGLKNFRPYDLRHAFASKLAMAGRDLNTIRELLGHADLSTTLIYAHLSEDHKAKAIKEVFG